MKTNRIPEIVAVVLLALFSGSVWADGTYSGGTGEPNDPYRIATPNDLNDIGNHVEDFNKCFVMVNDINLADYTGTQFNIIGGPSKPFSGVFDGNGHTISNFSYDTSGTNLVGVFRCIKGKVGKAVEIKNIRLIDPNVNAGTGEYVGSLIGQIDQGPAQISNCHADSVKVWGGDEVGGLIGAIDYWETAVVSECSSGGVVKGHNMVGGLIGYQYLGKVFYSCSDCNTEGNWYVGGLVGYDLEGDIRQSYSSGTVTGTDGVGGLVGSCLEFYTTPEILNCYSAAGVYGNQRVGGFIGRNTAAVYSCFSTGRVVGTSSVGGLIGDGSTGIVSSFWDMNSSGLETSDGGVGKTTVEMQTMSTFTDAGWDFVEVWDIGENQTYPYLRVYPAGDLNHDGRVDFSDVAILCSHWLEEK